MAAEARHQTPMPTLPTCTLSPHHAAAADATARLQTLLGDRLLSVVLFGSVARSRQRDDSDVDLLVVVQGPLPRLAKRWDALAAALEPAELALRTSRPYACLSPVVRSPEEVRRGNPLYYDMTQPDERAILFDRDGFMAGWLQTVADKMRHYGSRRLFANGAWYWDLAPGHGADIDL